MNDCEFGIKSIKIGEWVQGDAIECTGLILSKIYCYRIIFTNFYFMIPNM